MKPRYFILVAIGSVAVALGVLFATALKKHNNGLAKIERIPDITLTTIDGEDFSVVGLNPEHKTAILFFSPDCEFCRKELEGVVFYKDSFADIDWVFVTFLPREDLDEFLLEYPLYAIPGAKICIAESPEPFTAFDVTAPPSLFIYDAGGHLEHYKCGAVSIKTILEWTE